MMPATARQLCLWFGLAAAVPGCFWATTKSEGEALRKDVDGLKAKVDADLSAKVTELRGVLDEATRVLKRNSADLGAEVEATKGELRTMRGLVAAAKTAADELQLAVDKLRLDHEARLAALEAKLSGMEQKPAPPSVTEDLWAMGKAAFEKGRHDEARELFRRLVTQQPTHERADDAQYFRGESFFTQKEWEASIREYQRVFDKYPDSPLADDALFRAGEAAQTLKNCTEARAYFGLLRQKYPQSTLLKKAGDKDKQLKADAKNKAKCSG